VFTGSRDTMHAMLVERDQRDQPERRPRRPACSQRGVEQSGRAGTIPKGTGDGSDPLHVGVSGASRRHRDRDGCGMQQIVDE
jgi:hypothetical protein